jgi:pyruvate/2-oxoglutarate/acetoin dehydrogenase E1 component
MRTISYCEAIREALFQEMERDSSVFVYGIGVPDHKGIFGSVDGLAAHFGTNRCRDTPISEDSMTGVGIGAALAGMRPVHVHIRVDFLLLAMNQIANSMTTVAYNSGGELSVPMVIRAVVGRGWGQGCQHSKSMFSTFAHIPGLKVLAPTTPQDAKGLLIAAIRDDNPVLMLEHRWLYWQTGNVSPDSDPIEIGSAKVLRPGKDLTIVAVSWMNVEAAHAADMLSRYHDVSAEIVDVRSLAPLDTRTIVESVRKTGRCMIADNDWISYGASAEIATQVYSNAAGSLRAEIVRLGFEHTPCPTVRHLENEFYPNAATIFREAERMLGLEHKSLEGENFYSHENRFKGPF